MLAVISSTTRRSAGLAVRRKTSCVIFVVGYVSDVVTVCTPRTDQEVLKIKVFNVYTSVVVEMRHASGLAVCTVALASDVPVRIFSVTEKV